MVSLFSIFKPVGINYLISLFILLPYPECHVNGIFQSFEVGLFFIKHHGALESRYCYCACQYFVLSSIHCIYCAYPLLHPLIYEHLGCACVWAIANSAAMNILGYVYLSELQFCPDICPGVRLLDHMVALFLVFWGISILFSIVTALIHIPTICCLFLLVLSFSCKDE